MFSDWGKVKVPSDAQFEVTVIGLDGADGEGLFGDARFDASDEKKLEELEKKYGSESPNN